MSTGRTVHGLKTPPFRRFFYLLERAVDCVYPGANLGTNEVLLKAMAEKKKDRYAEAGVDIDAGNRFVNLIRPIVSKTFKSGVMTDLGGFAGICSIPMQDFKTPLLVASTVR